MRQAVLATSVAEAARRKTVAMKETRIAAHTASAPISESASRPSQFEYPFAATLTKSEVCACIEDTGLIPSVNEESLEDAFYVTDTLAEAGIPIVEVNMNAPNAVELLSQLVKHAPKTIVGCGGVRNADTARQCSDAGAKFFATDGFISGVLEFAQRETALSIIGALTLTEVISAWNAGADFVKVVPCHAVGGPKYIRTLKDAIPYVRLIAAGGVNQLTAANYIMAGATAMGVGKGLIPTEAVQSRQTGRIQELARRFLSAVDNGRD
jgi:2-dehydro-3-deoxyphosphogluconate aldolase/(4S)-4-hydroxy-2-oxoglutarate aldolase